MKNIIKALYEAQKEFKPVKKITRAYNYKYATLDGVLEMVLPILHNKGILFSQAVSCELGKESGEQKIRVTTSFYHAESGEEFLKEGLFPLSDIKGNKAQAAGASITYAKRYHLCALLGIESEDDTDGVVEEKANKKSYKVEDINDRVILVSQISEIMKSGFYEKQEVDKVRQLVVDYKKAANTEGLQNIYEKYHADFLAKKNHKTNEKEEDKEIPEGSEQFVNGGMF